MKYNVICEKNELINKIDEMTLKSEMKVNIVGRLMTISRYHNGYTLWWGEHYGIDCEDADDIVDKLEMLTSFVIEGKMNENECYITKDTERNMKESSRC